MKRIAIFASGEGSNAEAIVKYFSGNDDVKVEMVLSNKVSAGVHDRMEAFSIPSTAFTKEQWDDATIIVDLLQKKSIDLVVLAGFLAIIPSKLIEAYKGKIINIHPSLLPRHGGKGMWGMNVHKAVLEAGDEKSGITIHFVDVQVDGGKIIEQQECEVLSSDTPESLAQRIHQLEYYHYPRVIERLLFQNESL